MTMRSGISCASCSLGYQAVILKKRAEIFNLVMGKAILTSDLEGEAGKSLRIVRGFRRQGASASGEIYLLSGVFIRCR